MSKKIVIPLVVLVLLALGIGGFFLLRKSNTTETAETQPGKKIVVEEVNTLPVAERPYLKLHPEADGHNVTFTIESQKKTATEAEYELEYQAGTLLQGAFGKVDLAQLPSSTKILLGSCSAGGACTYHTDVQGGTLLTRYSDTKNFALKSEWRYFDNATKSPDIASKDAKFQLSSPELAKQRYMIVFNTPGYPEGLEGTPASEIFSLETSSALSGKGTLSLRADQEGVTKIAVWDGAEWQYVDGTGDGKTVTAEVPLAMLYVAVVN